MMSGPSTEHKRLTSLVFPWLCRRATGRGVRGAPEVQLETGYVADAVALCSFQHRYDQQLTNPAFRETVDGFQVQVEHACIFEVKVSRADFLSTFNNSPKHANRKQSAGSLHWLVAPKGIARPGELPDFWGVLETTWPNPRYLYLKKWPIHCRLSEATLDRIGRLILWKDTAMQILSVSMIPHDSDLEEKPGQQGRIPDDLWAVKEI